MSRPKDTGFLHGRGGHDFEHAKLTAVGSTRLAPDTARQAFAIGLFNAVPLGPVVAGTFCPPHCVSERLGMPLNAREPAGSFRQGTCHRG